MEGNIVKAKIGHYQGINEIWKISSNLKKIAGSVPECLKIRICNKIRFIRFWWKSLKWHNMLRNCFFHTISSVWLIFILTGSTRSFRLKFRTYPGNFFSFLDFSLPSIIGYVSWWGGHSNNIKILSKSTKFPQFFSSKFIKNVLCPYFYWNADKNLHTLFQCQKSINVLMNFHVWQHCIRYWKWLNVDADYNDLSVVNVIIIDGLKINSSQTDGFEILIKPLINCGAPTI